MRALMLGLALAAAISAAAAASASGGSRLVAFELREGGRVIGTPSLAVRIGEPASVSVGGPQGYALSLVVEQANDGPFLVRSRLYRPGAGGWTLVASPSLLVAPGEQARATMGAAPAPAYTIAVRVR